MDGGHSQNVGADAATPLSKAPYFENAPTLGPYSLHNMLHIPKGTKHAI
jgi:hypothetical protein